MERPVILLVAPQTACNMLLVSEFALIDWETVLVEEMTEALAAIKQRRPDMVITHLPIDRILGMDLPAMIREVDPFSHLPLVVLCENIDEATRCHLLNSGVDDILLRSTSFDEIVARLRVMLRMKEIYDQLAASRAALQEALGRERKLLAKLQKDNANLQQLATTDPLTRAQNVRSFSDILAHEFKMAQRYNQPLSLLMLDLDHFKLVNDTYGHPSGDYVLKELAVIFKRSVRESDVICRTGGEEFSIILPRADRRRTAVFARRICREVRAHLFQAYGHDIHLTVSVGSASYPADAEITEPNMLVYFADQALLAAKEDGRDRHVAVNELGMATRNRLRWQFQAMTGNCSAETRQGPAPRDRDRDLDMAEAEE